MLHSYKITYKTKNCTTIFGCTVFVILCYLLDGFVFCNITVKPVATLTLGHSMLFDIANYLHESGKADNQLGYLRLQERPEQQKSLADWWGSGYSRPQNFPFHNRRLRTLWHSPHAVWWQGWNPGCLLYKKGIGIRKNKKEFTHPFSWSGYVVRSILAKQEYCGDTVNFRTHKESYKDKSSVKIRRRTGWYSMTRTKQSLTEKLGSLLRNWQNAETCWHHRSGESADGSCLLCRLRCKDV